MEVLGQRVIGQFDNKIITPAQMVRCNQGIGNKSCVSISATEQHISSIKTKPMRLKRGHACRINRCLSYFEVCYKVQSTAQLLDIT